MALVAPYTFNEDDPETFAEGQAATLKSRIIVELIKEYRDRSGHVWYYDPDVSAWATESEEDTYPTFEELSAARGTLLADWPRLDAS